MSSIYRRSCIASLDENDVRSTARSAVYGPGPVVAKDTRDWKLCRKAEPANVVLPATRRWASELPAGIEPLALQRRFPRIANRLANAWQDPSACRLIFEDLLVDRRPGRQGFPPDVLHDLLRLRAHFLGDDLPILPRDLRHWSARRMKRE